MLHNFITLLVQEPTLIYSSICMSGAWVALFNFQYSLWEVSVTLKSLIQAVAQLCNLIKRADTCLRNFHLKTLLLTRAAGSVCGTILWEKKVCCWFASIFLEKKKKRIYKDFFTRISTPSWPGKTECQPEKNCQEVREEKASALPEDLSLPSG